MTKIYAKQIPPEVQVSPWEYSDDILMEGIVLTGNRDYQDYISADFDLIQGCFDNMVEDWCSDCDCSLENILTYYGFTRSDNQAWTSEQLEQWWNILEHDYSCADNAKTILAVLELLTGHVWKHTQITGCCQGDWQGVYYDTELWDRDSIRNLEIEYFNLGTEWIIHDGENIPVSPDDIGGYGIYCYGQSDDEIRKEIADCVGGTPDDVVLYAFDHYVSSPVYRLAE